MSKVLKNRAVAGQKLVQHWLAVIVVAAPKDVMMCAGHDLNRVELDKSQPLDDPYKIERTCRCIGKALRCQPKLARGFVWYADGFHI